jgi:hypothetical protein
MIEMRSIGFATLRDSDGKGFLGCMGAIIALAALIFVGIKLGPVYYSNYVFEEELKSVVSRAGSRYTPDDKIITEIVELAQQNGINITHEKAGNNIKIERFAGQIHIKVQYFVPVDFLIIRRNLRFHTELSSFTAS